MKFVKLFFLLGILIIGVGSTLHKTSDEEYYKPNTVNARELEIQQVVQHRAEDFHQYVRDSLYEAMDQNALNPARLQQRFLRARLAYKKLEWAAEYFIGPLAQRINGPPDQEVENADLLDPSMTYAVNPTGLQVIEELIFPEYDPSDKRELLKEIKELEKNSGFLVSYFKDNTLADWRILDAAKLEVFRIITLGITGFDNEETLNSMEESATSLKNLRKVLELYTDTEASPLLGQIDAAVGYLQQNTDFDAFDRAEFITTYANAISSGIADLEKEYKENRLHYNRLLNQNARTLFDEGAFNVNAFAPGAAYHLTDAKVKLGEKLFYESRLSGDASRSCFTCHQPALGFADGMAKNSFIYDENEPLPRNTPTLLNSALQSNYFHDMRALTLEDQTLDVIQNSDEMDGDLAKITAYLSQDSTYQRMFKEAFPSKKGETIETYQVANALASYVRSLTKLNSRFDAYMQGDKTAMTADEIAGFNLFMGKAKCATCHFVPLFNGTTPPKYMETETEVIGVPRSLTDSIIDPDKGWYEFIGVDSYEHAFKTPTVRNTSLTAPYMHNGIYPTLEEVMEFYNNAGSIGLGYELENNTLPEDSLQLSDREISQIVSFMESLEDRF